MENKTFIFTFGVGHTMDGFHQPIIAVSSEKAREKMFDAYGSEWAFEYTADEFNENKEKGFFRNNRPLETIE